jgi:hypothetical protein
MYDCASYTSLWRNAGKLAGNPGRFGFPRTAADSAVGYWYAPMVSACTFLLVSTLLSSQARSRALHLEVVEGDGAIDSIRQHRGHDPLVRVTDAGGQPLAGATVTFLLPFTGPQCYRPG